VHQENHITTEQRECNEFHDFFWVQIKWNSLDSGMIFIRPTVNFTCSGWRDIQEVFVCIHVAHLQGEILSATT